MGSFFSKPTSEKHSSGHGASAPASRTGSLLRVNLKRSGSKTGTLTKKGSKKSSKSGSASKEQSPQSTSVTTGSEVAKDLQAAVRHQSKTPEAQRQGGDTSLQEDWENLTAATAGIEAAAPVAVPESDASIPAPPPNVKAAAVEPVSVISHQAEPETPQQVASGTTEPAVESRMAIKEFAENSIAEAAMHSEINEVVLDEKAQPVVEAAPKTEVKPVTEEAGPAQHKDEFVALQKAPQDTENSAAKVPETAPVESEHLDLPSEATAEVSADKETAVELHDTSEHEVPSASEAAPNAETAENQFAAEVNPEAPAEEQSSAAEQQPTEVKGEDMQEPADSCATESHEESATLDLAPAHEVNAGLAAADAIVTEVLETADAQLASETPAEEQSAAAEQQPTAVVGDKTQESATLDLAPAHEGNADLEGADAIVTEVLETSDAQLASETPAEEQSAAAEQQPTEVVGEESQESATLDLAPAHEGNADLEGADAIVTEVLETSDAQLASETPAEEQSAAAEQQPTEVVGDESQESATLDLAPAHEVNADLEGADAIVTEVLETADAQLASEAPAEEQSAVAEQQPTKVVGEEIQESATLDLAPVLEVNADLEGTDSTATEVIEPQDKGDETLDDEKQEAEFSHGDASAEPAKDEEQSPEGNDSEVVPEDQPVQQTDENLLSAGDNDALPAPPKDISEGVKEEEAVKQELTNHCPEEGSEDHPADLKATCERDLLPSEETNGFHEAPAEVEAR